MTDKSRVSPSTPLTSLLLTAGDRLVAWLPRNLGANRQNVQRIINDLHDEGLVTFEPNPHHWWAQLVVLTDKGIQTYDAAMHLQAPWINELSGGLPVKNKETVHRVIMTLRKKQERGDESVSD